jgi:hypothetical protein
VMQQGKVEALDLAHMSLAEHFIPQMSAMAGRTVADSSGNEGQVRRHRVGPKNRPTSAVYSCIPTGMHVPTCIFWVNLTPFSLTAWWRGAPRGLQRRGGGPGHADLRGTLSVRGLWLVRLPADVSDVPGDAVERMSSAAFESFSRTSFSFITAANDGRSVAMTWTWQHCRPSVTKR